MCCSAQISRDLIVFDTSIEWDDEIFWKGLRPWGPGNSPRTAISEFLKFDKTFEIDLDKYARAQLSVCRDGFLKKVC